MFELIRLLPSAIQIRWFEVQITPGSVYYLPSSCAPPAKALWVYLTSDKSVHRQQFIEEGFRMRLIQVDLDDTKIYKNRI